MDDPLKPKSVPLAAETVLCFEFLLDPHKITKHLSKNSPEPSAVALLTEFISMTPDTLMPNYEFNMPASDSENISGVGPMNIDSEEKKPAAIEGLRIQRKQLALKILALKVATWLKWDLDFLEKNLPTSKQLYLLRDLLTLACGKLISIPLPADFQPVIAADGNERAARFAFTFYHRWVLRLQILKDIAMKSARPTIGNMFVPVEPLHTHFAPDIAPKDSIDYLTELCKSTEPFYVFTNETFQPLHSNSDNIKQNFDFMQQISKFELRAQIQFDMVNFYLYTKQYRLAREVVQQCYTNFLEMRREYQLKSKQPEDYIFCLLNENELESYLMACGVSMKGQTLMERFSLSQINDFNNIIEILSEDNLAREIPFFARRNVELDIECNNLRNSSEYNLLKLQVAALNVVRSIFEKGKMFACVEYFEKYKQIESWTTILDAITVLYPHCTPTDQNKLKHFVINTMYEQNSNPEYLNELKKHTLFTNVELEEIARHIVKETIVVDESAKSNDWTIVTEGLPHEVSRHFDVHSKIRQLINCTDSKSVRTLLVQLASTNPLQPLWTVNPSWEIHISVKSILLSTPPSFHQDFAYVLLGKSRTQALKNEYNVALHLLGALKNETQRTEYTNLSIGPKIGKLVTWEILLLQITKCFDDWELKPVELQTIGNRCKNCLNALAANETIIPRMEIVESCVVMLLNLSEHNTVMAMDKCLPQLELPIAFAKTMSDMEKMKGPKKVSREAWDILLSMFVSIPKRTNGSGSARNSPSLPASVGLRPFLKRIRSQTLFSVCISLMGKILNLLKEDPNNDLSGEFMQLWPTNINNHTGYNGRAVSETLHWLLTEALKYYPQTLAWLKMKGDLELANNNNEAAMRCYVNALISGTEYCHSPLQRNVADDFLIRRMMRCAVNLGCFTQATILCQFMDDIDYSLVNKNLSEKSCNFTDAMDAYYNCIWDATLLEFVINLHTKRGEHSRKLEAMSIMSSLELNANNNEEIKNQAAAVRKTRFLRALAKQYLL
ncbi:integrator complex subunit 8-like [Teleopsis dalmanni]|uniref:integrator complex subunit 8-like n=1 Tax=Teleopsis dalmanni TaxID=139649 RepID=UPI0018CD69F4|nr:integrator complex subunit 8-like [Teleopsis dalmanni]